MGGATLTVGPLQAHTGATLVIVAKQSKSTGAVAGTDHVDIHVVGVQEAHTRLLAAAVTGR